MAAWAVALTAVLSGLLALSLTRWMRTLARTESGWLTSGMHVVLAGAGGMGAAVLARNWAELLAFALLAAACALLVVIDLAAYRLPDAIVGPMYPILFAALLVAAATGNDWGRLVRAAAAAAAVTILYFGLALARTNLGLGDVKLSGLLAAFLGWLGWPQVLLGSLAGFAVGGFVAALLLLSRRVSPGSDFPYGPWLIAGAVIGAGWGRALLSGSP